MINFKVAVCYREATMQNAAGQLGFALAAIAFAVGAISYLLLGLKELIAAMREYSESLDRDEEYQKLTYLRANYLKGIGLIVKAAALGLASGLAADVFREYIFWTYAGIFILAAAIIAWRSERKYLARLKKELRLK